MNERRQDNRVEDDLGIAINLMSETGPIPQRSSTIFHLTRDISRGGIRFENDHELPLNSLLKVHVAIKMPLLTITHFGRVRWVKKAASDNSYAVGVQFTESPPNDMQVWSNYVDQRVHTAAA
jgi:hypothetical protein